MTSSPRNSAIPVARWPVPEGTPSVALMGGTFDPVHRGHVELGLVARDAPGVMADWLVFMPAARNPLKAAGPSLTDRLRVELLSLACAGHERVGVSTLELEEAGDHPAVPSYTVDTLRMLAMIAPGVSFRLVIGADSARSFHQWRSPREIIALAPPAVLLRAPDESPDLLLAAMSPHWSAAELETWRTQIVSAPLMPISATRIRQLIERHEWTSPELRDALHPDVLRRLQYEARD